MCPPTKMYVYIVFTDTSRPKKATELDGVEYHFITREEMESALVAHRYLFYSMLPCSNPTYFFLCLKCDLLIQFLTVFWAFMGIYLNIYNVEVCLEEDNIIIRLSRSLISIHGTRCMSTQIRTTNPIDFIAQIIIERSCKTDLLPTLCMA